MTVGSGADLARVLKEISDACLEQGRENPPEWEKAIKAKYFDGSHGGVTEPSPDPAGVPPYPEPDPIVAAVRDDLLRRSEIGLRKYGVTLARDDVKLPEWLQLAYEEALDMACYLKRAMMEMEGK